MKHQHLAIALLSLSLGAGLPACGGGGSPAPAAEEPATAAPPPEAAKPPAADNSKWDGDPVAGAVVFKANCVACHQADGTGMGGALGADFVNDLTRRAKSNAQLFNSVTNGVEGTAMIGWSAILEEQQRKDAIAYIRAEFMK